MKCILWFRKLIQSPKIFRHLTCENFHIASIFSEFHFGMCDLKCEKCYCITFVAKEREWNFRVRHKSSGQWFNLTDSHQKVNNFFVGSRTEQHETWPSNFFPLNPSLLSLFVNNTEAFVDKFKINYVVNFHVGRFINWTSELWTTELIVLRLDFFKCTLPSIIRFVLCVSIVVRVAEKKCLCWEEIWIFEFIDIE